MVAGGRLRVEIRTVNHRFFNVALKLPANLAVLEPDLREQLRRDFERGHIAVTGRWAVHPQEGDSSLYLNLERARAVVAHLRELQTALGIGGEVDVGLVARQPDVLGSVATELTVAWSDVEAIVLEAVAECKAMRRREGAVLVAEMRHRLDRLETLAAAVAARAPERLTRERDRLRQAVADLLDGRQIDDSRLAQEVALIADKLDVTEELVRLRAHVAAARDSLATDGPVGKRLGFLAQEMGREINTLGAKANDAEIATAVIDMKGDLEKLREQLENVE
jgi:uncharacterized protein (TIGR00255 family)